MQRLVATLKSHGRIDAVEVLRRALERAAERVLDEVLRVRGAPRHAVAEPEERLSVRLHREPEHHDTCLHAGVTKRVRRIVTRNAPRRRRVVPPERSES